MSGRNRLLSLLRARIPFDWCPEPKSKRSMPKAWLFLTRSYFLKGLFLGGSLKSFSALLLTIALASTFFSGINLGTDTMAGQILDWQLSQAPVDVEVHLGRWQPTPPPDDIARMMNEINSSKIEGLAHVEVTSRFATNARLPQTNETKLFWVVGISDNSIVCNGLALVNGSSALGANEAYLWTGSTRAENLTLGDELQSERLNLTVVGLVDLDERALGIAKGSLESTRINLVIVDWSKTLAEVPIDRSMGIQTRILILLDRHLFINLLDIDGSIMKANRVTEQIGEIVVPGADWPYGVENHLERSLNEYGKFSQFMRLNLVVTSLPVFFLAWYMGGAVSDVSYNLRRRQIGLLLTKGFSRRNLLRMFLFESFLIGLIATAVGLGLSWVLVPYFVQGGGLFNASLTIEADAVALSLIFTLGLSLLAVLRPARRASKLEVAEALQEYRFVEEPKPYKSKWAWIALILGAYKIIMWIMGIHLMTVLVGGLPITNVLLMVLLVVWTFFDNDVLNFIGPILFLWGFTKIFIIGSSRFQEVVTRMVKFSGDLSVLSTKNARRSPARTAAIAFLVALIIGFGFQMIGLYASEQDYMFRQVRFDVGADVGVELDAVKNLTPSLERIRDVPGISCAGVEYEFSGDLQAVDHEIIHIKAVNPEEWLDAAYYEDVSFGGRDVPSAFGELRRDNHTIILEHRVANMLGLNIGDEVAVKLYGSIARPTFNFKVVGFFGPKPPPGYNPSYEWSWYWSYMHEDVYLSIMEEPYRRGRMLVKVAPDADDASIAEEIRNLQLINVLSVYSVTESLNQWLKSPIAPQTAQGFFQGVTVSTELHQLGVVFAVLAASVGTALVTFVSLEERRKEVGVMSVRGLSFGQIAKVLLCENLAVVGFAVLLGAAMGIATLHGNLCALGSAPTRLPGPTQQTWASYYTPTVRRMVFPSDSILALAGCCILVLASAMIPTLFTTRRFIYEIERIVRGA